MNVCASLQLVVLKDVPICRVPKEKVVSEFIRDSPGHWDTVEEAWKDVKERAASIDEMGISGGH